MAVRILTDSASDFTRDELAEYGVELIPMPVQCGERTIIDDKTVPVETFWQLLLDGVTLATSQPTPDSFVRAFEAAREADDEVVCVLISTALSGTVQGAHVARNLVGYDGIFVVDSGQAAAAAAQKLLVLRACELRDEGALSAQEIAQELERFKGRIRLYACLDTLDYLARGGRLPRAVASLGSAVKMKPIITLGPSGEIKVAKKALGAKRALNEMVRLVGDCAIDPAYPAIPIYAHAPANCETFVGRLRAEGFLGSLKPCEGIGATIGTYIGPGAYGIALVERA